MVERLKQIWSGFSGVTTRRLTGRGVENILVPHRDHKGADAAPEGAPIPAPAAIAFDALKSRLAAPKKAARDRSDDDTSPPPPALAPESAAARDLIRGLKSTEARLARSERLYGEAVSMPEKKGLFRGASLKKRFIFF
ncbi:MAG: hypothetical protein WD076_10325 [Parvularculaceae bacterium]